MSGIHQLVSLIISCLFVKLNACQFWGPGNFELFLLARRNSQSEAALFGGVSTDFSL